MRNCLAYLVVMMGASQAAALSIPTTICEMGGGKYANDIYVHDASDEWLPGMTTFVETSDVDGGYPVAQVIAHCASGQAVRYHDNDMMSDEAYDKLRQMIEGDEAFTLRQLATKLKQKGVKARFVTNAKRHCACKPETHKPSF